MNTINHLYIYMNVPSNYSSCFAQVAKKECSTEIEEFKEHIPKQGGSKEEIKNRDASS